MGLVCARQDDEEGAVPEIRRGEEEHVGDMHKSPSSQYGLKAREDIDPRGIRVTNRPMR